jgi:hypothetical protein
MDDLVKFVIDAARPPWNYLLAGIGLAVLGAPQFVKLSGIFYDIKSKKSAQAAEKERLEILKLRYEIEALKKEHGLAEIVAPALAEKSLPKAVETIAPLPASVTWLSRNPRLGKALLLPLQGVLGFLLAIFGISVVIVPIGLIGSQEGPMATSDILALVLLPLAYGLLAWGCYVALRRIHRWKTLIGKVA